MKKRDKQLGNLFTLFVVFVAVVAKMVDPVNCVTELLLVDEY